MKVQELCRRLRSPQFKYLLFMCEPEGDEIMGPSIQVRSVVTLLELCNAVVEAQDRLDAIDRHHCTMSRFKDALADLDTDRRNYNKAKKEAGLE